MARVGAAGAAKGVDLMLFDVDGVLTDGTLYIGDAGECMKGFNVRDGHGIKMLMDAGIRVGLLTSRRSRIVEVRAAELGVKLVLQGEADKGAAYARLLLELGLAPERTGHMGDDLPDLPVLLRCGFAATVPEAPESLKNAAHYVSKMRGGNGAAREVCEFILAARGIAPGTERVTK